MMTIIARKIMCLSYFFSMRLKFIFDVYEQFHHIHHAYTCMFLTYIHAFFACTMASNESLPSRVKEFHKVRFLWPTAHVHASTSVYPCVEANARAVRHFSYDVFECVPSLHQSIVFDLPRTKFAITSESGM